MGLGAARPTTLQYRTEGLACQWLGNSWICTSSSSTHPFWTAALLPTMKPLLSTPKCQALYTWSLSYSMAWLLGGCSTWVFSMSFGENPVGKRPGDGCICWRSTCYSLQKAWGRKTQVGAIIHNLAGLVSLVRLHSLNMSDMSAFRIIFL